VVGRVAHPGGTVFGQDRFDGRPRFGVEQPAQCRHAVGLLRSQPQEPFAGAFHVVGFGTVLIDRRGQPVGSLAQLLRTRRRSDRRQRPFGQLAHLWVHPPGQPVEKRSNDHHVSGAERAAGLGVGGGGQLRRQRLPAQCGARSEILCLAEPAADFLARDPKPLGEHAAQRLRAEFDRGRFPLQPGDDSVPDGGQLPGHRFQFAQQLDQFVLCEPITIQGDEFGDRSADPRDCCGDPIRTHTRTLIRPTDKKFEDVTPETTVTQGFQ